MIHSPQIGPKSKRYNEFDHYIPWGTRWAMLPQILSCIHAMNSCNNNLTAMYVASYNQRQVVKLRTRLQVCYYSDSYVQLNNNTCSLVASQHFVVDYICSYACGINVISNKHIILWSITCDQPFHLPRSFISLRLRIFNKRT